MYIVQALKQTESLGVLWYNILNFCGSSKHCCKSIGSNFFATKKTCFSLVLVAVLVKL